jgi:uncharacterized protein
MAELTIRAESVKETPRHFRLETDDAWWAESAPLFRDPSVRALEPFVAEIDAYRLGARLLFRGHLVGSLELRCSRCGEPVTLHVSEPLELLLEPAQNPALIPEGGIELDAEDLELGRYAGDELNFGPVVLEILALAWPMQPLCSESCQGLCPMCGAVRSHEVCACETQQTNRPFAALSRMLQDTGKRRGRRN